MKSAHWLKVLTLPTLLALILSACGGGSTITSVNTGSSVGSAPGLESSASGTFTLAESVPEGTAAGSVVLNVVSDQELPPTVAFGDVDLVRLPIPQQPGATSYAAMSDDSVTLLTAPVSEVSLGVTNASVSVASTLPGADGTALIYQGNPAAVTFSDFVLIRALSSLPPNQRTPENIVTLANELFPGGNFTVEGLDPIPDATNTDFASGGSFPAPDLVDALVVYAASFLPANQRNVDNIAATANALAPGIPLAAEDILAIPGVQLPGGLQLVLSSTVSDQAGQIQISVEIGGLETESFEVDNVQFTQLGVQPFPGFTSYAADLASSTLPVEFDRLSIDGTFADTCVVVHEPGTDPTDASNQLAVSPGCSFEGPTGIVINELDADQPGSEDSEFVELFGPPNTSLDGLVLVLFNGSDDQSYDAVDLDGQSTDSNGFFVIGDAGVPNAGIQFPMGSLQNGADAVALYTGNAADFPNDTPVTTAGLIDAVVYGTDDPDATGLLPLLNPGQAQANEGSTNNPDSLQRIPNGSGGARNTDTFAAFAPTPGMENTESMPEMVRIREIQGTDQTTSRSGEAVVNVPGIVTLIETDSSEGFYMQDPDLSEDDGIASSEGIFVFTNEPPPVSVGDAVFVSGTVSEFGFGSDLTQTQIDAQSGSITEWPTSFTLGDITPVVLGVGGRVPPSMVIDDDGLTSFDAATDGIDFYESVEGMLVQVNNPQVVQGLDRFGQIFVVSDDGANASPFTANGGLFLDPPDFNPERIQIDGRFGEELPNADVGDTLSSPVVGVVSYSFTNFEILTRPGEFYTTTSGGTSPEVSALTPEPSQLTVATYNVLNLDPGDTEQLAGLGTQIVNNLSSPDIIGLQEIQDNNGTDGDDSVTDATQTFQALINAITTAGGPAYEFINISPETPTGANPNPDGGAPGSNIQVGFLYNPARVGFTERNPGGTLDDNTVVAGPQLQFNPGRILDQAFDDESAGAPAGFDGTRKPLAAEFTFNGQTIFAIVNHFKSKSGDDGLFGGVQPPVLETEVQRTAQAEAVEEFVDDILTLDSNAKVIVLGDFNDFEFSPPLQELTSGGLTNLMDNLLDADRYTFNFQGNSQTLDHILVSDDLLPSVEIDAVHINADFGDETRSSDHDPVLARFTIPSLID